MSRTRCTSAKRARLSGGDAVPASTSGDVMSASSPASGQPSPSNGVETVEIANRELGAALGMAVNLERAGWERVTGWQEDDLWVVRMKRHGASRPAAGAAAATTAPPTAQG